MTDRNVTPTPMWAVVCGQIRSDVEFRAIIGRLIQLRIQGILEGIVVSTWEGGVTGCHEDLLRKTGIALVRTPRLDDCKLLQMNYTRQILLFNAGLKAIPENVFVLKCRTDFSLDCVNLLVDSLSHISFEKGAENRYNVDFSYKILVQHISTTAPFFFRDVAFIGFKEDLKKMVVYETQQLSGHTVAPDCLFCASPFIHRFYHFTIMMENFPAFLRKANDVQGIKNILENKVMANIFIDYYQIIRNNFVAYIGNLTDINVQPRDLFTGGSPVCRSWQCYINDIRILESAMANADCEDDVFSKIVRMARDDQHYTLTDEDYREFYSMVDVKKKCKPISYECDDAFTGFSSSESCNQIFRGATNPGNLYIWLAKNLNRLELVDDSQYLDCILAQWRLANPAINLETAVLLQDGRFHGDDLARAEWIFEMGSKNGLIFKRVPEQIAADMLYCDYIGSRSNFSTVLIKNLLGPEYVGYGSFLEGFKYFRKSVASDLDTICLINEAMVIAYPRNGIPEGMDQDRYLQMQDLYRPQCTELESCVNDSCDAKYVSIYHVPRIKGISDAVWFYKLAIVGEGWALEDLISLCKSGNSTAEALLMILSDHQELKISSEAKRALTMLQRDDVVT